MTNFRVMYIDESEQRSKGVVLTIDCAAAVIPRKGESVQIDNEDFVVEFVVHSFISGSQTQVVEVHIVNGFEFCMRE